MTIRKLNDYRHEGLISVERVCADDVLTKDAMAVYTETDPLEIFVDDDGLYYVRGCFDRDEMTCEQLNDFILGCLCDPNVVLNGVMYDIEVVAVYMDDEIREDLHHTGDFQSEQEFLEAYCAAHEQKFGEEFVMP